MVCLTSTFTARKRYHTGCEVSEMGLFKRKRKAEKKEEKGKEGLSREDVEKLMVLFGHLKITSVEDEDAARLYGLLNKGEVKREEILKVWDVVMKRGERVFRMADVGFEFRKLADAIRFDNEGRVINGKDVNVIVGGTTEKVFAEYGVGLKELTGKEPKYPYTGTGFAMVGNGMILPELYLTKSYKPLFIYMNRIKGDGKSDGARLMMFM